VQGGLNAVLVGLHAAERAVSSIAMQEYSCERVCEFYELIPRIKVSAFLFFMICMTWLRLIRGII
jgi:hypothetical protein